MQHDDHTTLFMQHRPVLRRLAYRMLSCVSLAEDAVQETWLRWHSVDVTQIESAKAWLITTLSRICIDELRRLKREQSVYVGPWLPEPIFTDDEAPDPADIFDRSLPGIQQDAGLVSLRNLHDQGTAVLEVEIAERVDDVVVAGLQRLVDLQTLVEDEQLVRLDADPARAFGYGGEADQWLAPDVGLYRPLIVELVVQALTGGC